jgi:hypothetical protein
MFTQKSLCNFFLKYVREDQQIFTLLCEVVIKSVRSN